MSNSVECAAYLRSQPGYDRCLEALGKKWESYGRLAGQISLPAATQEERRLIGGIVGKTFSEETVVFSCAEFERGLQKTRFAPVDMRELLEAYFGRKLVTRQEQKKQRQQEKNDFLEGLYCFFDGEPEKNQAALAWIRGMAAEKKSGYQLLMREWGKDRAVAESLAGNVGKALGTLCPGQEWRQGTDGGAQMRALAVFAAEISGNPHYFDRGSTAGQLLTSALCSCLDCQPPRDASAWRELLRQVGMEPDTVSSMVHACGLRLRTAEGSHPAYEAFCRRREACVITLENLRGIVGASGKGRTVYVVENEMVFSCLLERAGEQEAALLCTSGQPRTAAFELLSLIIKEGSIVRYSGDMDPEGLEIADRLWRRYGDAVEIWRMSPPDYEKGLSGEPIDGTRLSKLDRIANPLLQSTAARIRERGLAAYQENILEDLARDIGGG